MYSNISDIYAGKLFGGTYIFCLYIGMMVGEYFYEHTPKQWKQRILLMLAGSTTIIMFVLIYTKGFVLDKYALLGSVINPPGITILFYAVTVLSFVRILDVFVSETGWKIPNQIVTVMQYIGKHTLYIFLYHRLFWDYFLNRFCSRLPVGVKIPVYFGVMISGAVIIEKIFGVCKTIIIKSYLYRGSAE